MKWKTEGFPFFFKLNLCGWRVKLFPYKPKRPIGHKAVETYRISRQSASCQPYAPAAFNPQKLYLILISVTGWVDSKAIVQPEGLSMKNYNDTIGNQTRDLPACRAGRQPTALRRAPKFMWVSQNSEARGAIKIANQRKCYSEYFAACTRSKGGTEDVWQHAINNWQELTSESAAEEES